MDNNSKENSRRNFVKTVATGTLAAAVVPSVLAQDPKKKKTAPAPAVKGPNDRLRIAVLGVNGRGKSHIEEIMKLSETANVEVAVLCDPDMNVLQQRAADFEKQYGKKVLIEQDFRKTLDDKTIDAVTIATPNHWHALQTIWACQAGKDVYVEKPATHNIYEGKKMIEAAYKYNRIVQHGVQLRSSVAIREAIQHL
jgi:predicted dehydrogenase